MFKKIVVALDESVCSARAFDLAVSLAKVEGSTVVVCSVVDARNAMWQGGSNPTAEHALEQAERTTQHIVAKGVAMIRKAGLNVEGRMLLGDAADEIVACAALTGADAIVMGTHGRSGLKHFVMGSVAEAVLRSAPCPVVVVRDQAPVPNDDVAS